MSKFLDLDGLTTLWGKIKNHFATKDELKKKQDSLGISTTGSANKFLNQQGQFATVETDLSAYAKKTDIPTTLPASDVAAWAKAETKPAYTKSEVGLGNVDNTADSAKDVKHAKSADSVAWSGVTGKPTIPTVNDSIITINQGGNEVASFSLNQSKGATINLQEGKVYSNATQTADGLMSSTDKKKLDGIGTGNYLTQEEADKRYMAKEHVVVTLTTTVGTVEGLKIHVQDSSGNEIAVQADLTWKGTAIEFDISAGVAYKIVGDTLCASGCAVFRTESAMRVSSAGGTNNVTLAYNPQKLNPGVYIETLDGKAVTADSYSDGLYQDNLSVNSILVVTSSWTGRILPDENDSIHWTPSNPGGKISKTMTNSSTDAEKDMNGIGNMEAIFNKYNRNITANFAAGYAYNQIFRSGKHGYLPSLGELKTIYANSYEVNKCLYKLAGKQDIIGNTYFWSSTQNDSSNAWCWQRSSNCCYWGESYCVLVLSAL